MGQVLLHVAAAAGCCVVLVERERLEAALGLNGLAAFSPQNAQSSLFRRQIRNRLEVCRRMGWARAPEREREFKILRTRILS
eukprot:4313264-Alexandrium_andersonii.AAC.1